MHRRVAALGALVLLFTAVGVAAQTSAEVQKLTDQYIAAFNKGDAKALAALHTTDALRVAPDGRLLSGRAEIEKDHVTAFGGPYKGAKLTLQQGKIQALTADVSLSEGTYEVTGGKTVMKGRYLNTLVKQSGQWRLASVTTVPEMPVAAK